MPSAGGSREQAACLRLLASYAELASRSEHLFGSLLAGQAPRQWGHYPEDDAIDQASGWQWFYHSHAPQDRPQAAEHGHIHLFARRKLWSRRLRSSAEMAFSRLAGAAPATHATRHLLCIGFDALGVPIRLFTVNAWVTGDRMLSAALSAELLENMKLNTGHPEADAVIATLLGIYRPEIRLLLAQRDEALWRWAGPNVLSDERLEVLSAQGISLDRRLHAILRSRKSG